MGPRPYERGKQKRLRGTKENPRTFNGAAPLRARKELTLRQAFKRWFPSMGPRPYERGKVRLWGRLENIAEPSMGPRPYERGKGDILYDEEAAMLPSMGPRPYERGKLV